MGLQNDDIVQIKFNGLCFNQQIQLVTNWRVDGDFPAGNSIPVDLAIVRTAVMAAGVHDIETPYLACLPPQYSLEEVTTQRVKLIRSAYFSTATPGTAGTNANAATVANDAAALTLRTALSGRNQVATHHIGPAPDGASAAGVLTNAYKALLSTLGTQLVTQISPAGVGGATLVPCIWHRPGATTNTITNFHIGTASRVQRRRTVGVGI